MDPIKETRGIAEGRPLIRTARGAIALLVPLLTTGCVLAPKETRNEQKRADQAGKIYQPPIEQRILSDLPAAPEWRDVLHRAFLTNGELESAYYEWQAALARIPQMAGYPNVNLAPSFSYMFSPGRMKSFDRLTTTVQFDPMQDLAFPTKVAEAGKIALADAQAAGLKFRQTKFEVQKRVMDGYLDLILQRQRIAIAAQNVDWLNLLADSARNRVGAGGAQQDLLRAQTMYRMADSDLAGMRSDEASMLAMLNGMMQRPPDAPLPTPATVPTARALPADEKIVAAMHAGSPELARLSTNVYGREFNLRLANQSWIPDINPMAGFTGGASQMLGAMLILPTTIPQIQGRIDEARAMLNAGRAMSRQAQFDRGAELAAALIVLHNAQRQADTLQTSVLPVAEQAVQSSRETYSAGRGSIMDLIDAQRTLLNIKQLIVESRIEREKRLAEVEALTGADIETIH